MKKYLRIYLLFVKVSVSLFLSHRFNVVMSALSSIIWTITQVIGLQFLFEKVETFAGWTLPETVLLLACGQMMFYSWVVVYEHSMAKFPQELIKGEVDRYLTRPVSLIFFISFKSVTIQQLIPMVTTVLPLMLYGLTNTTIAEPIYILQAFIILFFSLIIIYFMNLALLGVNFFIDNFDTAKDIIVNGSLDFNRVPFTILPSALRTIFTVIIPVAFVAFYPVMIIKGQESFATIFLYEMIILIIFILLSKLIWNKGLRRYSGVG